uniref:Putative salivary lipocalin n=1 Tax=Ixodes ricinus TaxID=34613 RepID=A0A0K8RIF4_IXORI
MVGQLATICYILVGAIIILPEAHSKVFNVNYDVSMELGTRTRYFLKYRSYQTDHAVRDAAYCVSLLPMHNLYGTWEAVLRYKQTLASQYTNKIVKIRPHHGPGTTVNNMMTITDNAGGHQLYDQKLYYTDYRSCRVMVEQFQGARHCSLWVSPGKRTSAIPQACSDAYSQICNTRHHNDDPARCP